MAPGSANSSAIIALAIPIDGEPALLAEGRRFADHPVAMSNQLYEINRGAPRLLTMLHELDLRATFFIPGMTMERHPRVVDAVLQAGHELAHHSYSHRKPIELSESEERADFERALRVMERFGIHPAGHRAASWAPSFRSLEYVREYGLLYDNSLMGHDQPYRVRTSGGELLEIPSHWILDDLEQYGWLPAPFIGRSIEPPRTAVSVWQEEARCHAPLRRAAAADGSRVPVWSSRTGTRTRRAAQSRQSLHRCRGSHMRAGRATRFVRPEPRASNLPDTWT